MSQQIQEKDVTFAEAKGLEANKHAKKLAKKLSEKKKKKYDVYYTKKANKVIKITLKPNGIYREYIGNLSKKVESEFLKTQIAVWVKNQEWVEEYHVDLAKKYVSEEGMDFKDAIKLALNPLKVKE